MVSAGHWSLLVALLGTAWVHIARETMVAVKRMLCAQQFHTTWHRAIKPDNVPVNGFLEWVKGWLYKSTLVEAHCQVDSKIHA